MRKKVEAKKEKSKPLIPKILAGSSTSPAVKSKSKSGNKTNSSAESGLRTELNNLRSRLAELEETLNAIRSGEVDALLVSAPGGDQVFTLKGAEQPYRLLVEEMNEGAATLNADGIVLYCNNSLSSMLEIPLQNVIGFPLHNYIAEQSLPSFDQFRRESLRDCGKRDVFLKRKSGMMPVLMSGCRLSLDDVNGISIVVTDMTLQKQAEETLRRGHKELERLVEESTFELRTHKIELEMQNHELRAAQEKLEGSRAKYADLYDFAPVGYFTLDRHGAIQEVNLAGSDKLEMNRQVLLKRPFRVFLAGPEDDDIFSSHLKNTLMSQLRQICDVRLKRNDGTFFYVQLQSVAVEINDGKTDCIRTAVMDISERRRAEENLRESRQRIADILESINDGFMSLDREWHIIYVNKRAARNVGFEPAELTGRNIWEAFSSFGGTEVEENFRKAMSERVSVRFVMTGTAHNNWHNVSVYPSSEGISVYWVDITERRRAEEALRQSEERYRLLVEVSPDSIMIHDGNTFLFVNAAAARLLGARGAEQLIGRPIFSVLHPHFHEIVCERIAAMKSGSRVLPQELKMLRLDGSAIDVESTGSSMILHGRHVFQIIIRDITERKIAEKRLHKENRMIAFVNRILEVFVKEAGDDIFEKALTIVNEAMKSSHGVFGYIDEHGDLICPTIAKLYDQCEIDDKCICYKRDEWNGLWSRALLEKKTLYTNVPAVVPAGHVPIQNNMATPILFQGEVIGLLNVANKETAFAEEDRNCIETISNRIAPVLFAWIQKELRDAERTRAEEQLIMLNAELENRVRERTEDLAKTIETLQSEMVDRLKAEEDLCKSQDNLKKAQAIAHIGSWHYDPHTKNLTWSDELYRIFGVDPTCFHGYLTGIVSKAIHPDDRKKVRRSLRQVLSGSSAAPLEYRIILPDGAERTVWAEGERISDEAGKTIGFIGTVQDITERNRAEEELARLAAAVESAADAVVITEPSRGLIQYVNPAFETITGYARHEVLGGNLHMLDSGRHDEAFYRNIRESIRRDGVWTGRLVNKKKDGTLYDEDCTYSPVKNSSGEVINYISVKRDVTEKVRLESIAQAVDTMNNIAYIFSGVRHEIGNPVTTISVSLGLTMKKLQELDKPTIAKHLKRCIEEVGKIEYLLRTLRNFNMYEQLDPRDIVLSDFMNKLLALVKDDFTQKKILMDVVVQPVDANVYADARALQQILLNLLTNAVDAVDGRENAKITVNAVKKNRMVLIRVHDNGCGIPANRLQEVFKPFFTTKAHGTGLGLMIVRKMIAKMNGTVEITSTEAGGTTVDILIPASFPEQTG